MLVNNKVFLPSTDASSSFNSLAYALENVVLFYIALTVTGSSLMGSVKLQVSGEPITSTDPTYQPSSASWVDYGGTTNPSSQPVTGSGIVAWNVDAVGFPWIRVVYTASSGTGTILGTINQKGF